MTEIKWVDNGKSCRRLWEAPAKVETFPVFESDLLALMQHRLTLTDKALRQAIEDKNHAEHLLNVAQLVTIDIVKKHTEAIKLINEIYTGDAQTFRYKIYKFLKDNQYET